MSIDALIKQAMAEAGLRPEEEIEKKATGNKLADNLYAIAAEFEKLGNAKAGVKAGSEQSCLRDLTKAYLFQRMLKSAVEDRLGISYTKSAGDSDIRVEYLNAFEKRAAGIGSAGYRAVNAAYNAIKNPLMAGAIGAGIAGCGAYNLGRAMEREGSNPIKGPELARLTGLYKTNPQAALDGLARLYSANKTNETAVAA